MRVLSQGGLGVPLRAARGSGRAEARRLQADDSYRIDELAAPQAAAGKGFGSHQ